MAGEIVIREPIGEEESIDTIHTASQQNECTFWECGCIRETGEVTSTELVEKDDQGTCDCGQVDSRTTEISPYRKPSRYLATYTFGKKAKLRTSKDVYDRLKWDIDVEITKGVRSSESKEILDVSSVYIGYKDRFLGICELPFEEYEPGGDIPFHRVYYFRTGGPPVQPFIGKDGEVKVREDNLPKDAVFIWDRDTRTDLIFNSGNSSFS